MGLQATACACSCQEGWGRGNRAPGHADPALSSSSRRGPHDRGGSTAPPLQLMMSCGLAQSHAAVSCTRNWGTGGVEPCAARTRPGSLHLGQQSVRGLCSGVFPPPPPFPPLVPSSQCGRQLWSSEPSWIMPAVVRQGSWESRASPYLVPRPLCWLWAGASHSHSTLTTL